MSTVLLLIALLLGAVAGLALGLVVAGGSVRIVSERRLASGYAGLGMFTQVLINLVLGGGGAVFGAVLAVLALLLLLRVGLR